MQPEGQGSEYLLRQNMGVILERSRHVMLADQHYVDLVFVVQRPKALPETEGVAIDICSQQKEKMTTKPEKPTLKGSDIRRGDLPPEVDRWVEQKGPHTPESHLFGGSYCEALMPILHALEEGLEKVMMRGRQAERVLHSLLQRPSIRSAREDYRKARGAPLEFVGHFSRWLFGTAMSSEIQGYVHTLQTVQASVHTIYEHVRQGQHITLSFMNQTAHSLQELAGQVVLQGEHVEKLEMAARAQAARVNEDEESGQKSKWWSQYFIAFLTSRQLKLSILIHYHESLQTFIQGLESLRLGTLSTSLVSPKEMRLALDQVAKSIAKKELSLVVIDLSFYYQNMLRTFLHSGSKLYIHLSVPVAKRPSFMNLFHIRTFGIPINSRHMGYTQVKNVPKAILVDNQLQVFTEIKDDELDRCSMDHILLCPFPLPVISFKHPSCALALFLDNATLARKLCQFDIKPFLPAPTFFEAVSPTEFVISHSTSNFSMNCGGKHIEMAPCDVCILKLKCECTVQVGVQIVRGSSVKCLEENITHIVHGVNAPAIEVFNIRFPSKPPSFNTRRTIHIIIPNITQRLIIAKEKFGENYTAPLNEFVKELNALKLEPLAWDKMTTWYTSLSATTEMVLGMLNSAAILFSCICCIVLLYKHYRLAPLVYMLHKVRGQESALEDDGWNVFPAEPSLAPITSQIWHSDMTTVISDMSYLDQVATMIVGLFVVFVLFRCMRWSARLICGQVNMICVCCIPRFLKRCIRAPKNKGIRCPNSIILLKVGNSREHEVIELGSIFDSPRFMTMVRKPEVSILQVRRSCLRTRVELNVDGPIEYNIGRDSHEFWVERELDVPIWQGRKLHKFSQQLSTRHELYLRNGDQILPLISTNTTSTPSRTGTGGSTPSMPVYQANKGRESSKKCTVTLNKQEVPQTDSIGETVQVNL